MTPDILPFWMSGLTDGVGVCGFTGLVFFVWFLVRVCRGRLQTFVGGLIYVSVVFWTMVSMGLGVFNRIITSDSFVNATRVFYFGVALVVFVLGCLSFYDWLLCRGIIKFGRQRFNFQFSESDQAGPAVPAWQRRVKMCVAILYVVVGLGISGFLLTLLASLRCPQAYVTAMVYSFSVDKLVFKAIGGMLIYAMAYVTPLTAAWVGTLVLLQLRRLNAKVRLGASQVKIISSAVLFALSFSLIYVLS